MSRKKYQTYNSEQKTKIVLEMLKEEATLARLTSKYNGLNPNSRGRKSF